MSLVASATAGVLDAARAQLAAPAAWPDPPSGFASRLLQAAGVAPPPAFGAPLRTSGAQVLRRAPDLAAFGYVIDRASVETQGEWISAFDRLTGREIFPSDRNSFIHIPLELIGIAFGLRVHPQTTDTQRLWLGGAIQRGFAEGQFLTPVARASAATAARLIGQTDAAPALTDTGAALTAVTSADLVLLGSLALLDPNGFLVDLATAETALVERVLSEPVPVRDTAEAAGLFILLTRAISRAAVNATDDPAARVVGLCRRFPLFVERLQRRQRSRAPVEVKDEYDVQDLLHAILKLHFDDVRPEEWTPSYGGNASRVDFLLPRERLVIEAKMTRASLGQKEVVNELTIDAARYEKVTNVDHLICVVYDPDRRCGNPAALETDLARTDGRLKVTAVVCPRGA
jgi:hypothetical protein